MNCFRPRVFQGRGSGFHPSFGFLQDSAINFQQAMCRLALLVGKTPFVIVAVVVQYYVPSPSKPGPLLQESKAKRD